MWGSCFRLDPAASPPPSVRRAALTKLITAPLLTPHLSQHNSSTSIISLITAQLITAPLLTPHLSHPHLSHQLSHHSSTSHTSLIILSQHNSSQLRGQQTAFLVAGAVRLPFAWQAQHTTELPGGVRRAWSPLGRGCLLCARRSTQSCPVELRRAWSPLGRGCFSRGRRSTQSLLEELRRAWSPLGRGCFSCGRRSTQSLRELLRRASCVAGAVHRASMM